METFDPVDHYRLELDHFARCIETGARPRTDTAEAIANMRVLDALYESADRGSPVTMT